MLRCSWPLPRLVGLLLIAALLLSVLLRSSPRPAADDPVQKLELEHASLPVLLKGTLLEDPRPLGVEPGQPCRLLLQSAGGRSELLLQACPRLQQGWAVQVRGRLRRPRQAPHPLLSGAAERLARQQVWSQVQVETLEVLQRPATPIADLRRQLARRFIAYAGAERGGVLAALVIGSAVVPLPPALSEAFRASGLSHALAASGFHLTVLLGASLALARPFGRVWRLLAGGAAIAGFLLLAGPQPSVVRAVLMGGLALLLLEAGLRSRALGLLGLSAGLMLLLKPSWMQDVGFQLSVAATAGLLVSAAPIETWLARRMGVEASGRGGESRVLPQAGAATEAQPQRQPQPTASTEAQALPQQQQQPAAEPQPRASAEAQPLPQETRAQGTWQAWVQTLKRWLAAATAVPLAATLWTLPLQLLHFGVIPLYAVPANLLAAPLLTPLTLGAMLLVVPALLLPALLPPLGWPVLIMTALLQLDAQTFAALPLAQCRTGRPGPLVMALLSLALLGLVLPNIGRRWRNLAMALATLGAVLQLQGLRADQLLLVHQGHADAGRDLLVARHAGRAALIASHADGISCRQGQQLALGLGVERFDWLVLLDPVAPLDPACWRGLSDQVLAQGSGQRPLLQGERLQSPGLELQALSSDSQAMTLRYGRERWLLLPDRQAFQAWRDREGPAEPGVWLGFRPSRRERQDLQGSRPMPRQVWLSGEAGSDGSWPRTWQASGRLGSLSSQG